MNIQSELINIHAKYGVTEMANYHIQKLFDTELCAAKKDFYESGKANGVIITKQEYEEKLRWIPVEEFDFKIKESNEPDIVICKEDNRYSVIEITDLYSVNYVKNNFSHCRYFL